MQVALKTSKKKTFRVLQIFLVLAVGVVSVNKGFVFGAIVSICVVGSLAILPRKNPLVYWPVGLFASLLTLYGAYSLMYFFGIAGLTIERASAVVGTAMVLLSTIASVRIIGFKRENIIDERHHWSAQILMATVSIGTLAIGIHHFYNDKTGMIAGFLSGGDHGIHVENMLDMLKESASLTYTSPFSLHDYPKGIHFFLANFFLIGQKSSTNPVITQQHLVPALFEYIQLAAFLQLAMLSGTKIRVKNEIARTLFVLASLCAFASIHKLGNHLFWSGFTTSLALCWILLIPIAVSGRDFRGQQKQFHSVQRMIFWILIAIAVWITYQPYVLIPLACLTVEIFTGLLAKWNKTSSLHQILNKTLFKTTAVVLGVSLVAAAPYLVQGSESLSVQRLILFGVCWRIPSAAVFVAVGAAAAFLLLASWKKKDIDMSSDVMLLAGVTSLTITIMVIAASASSDFTLTDAPYYVQKMYWVLFFVAGAILLKWIPSAIDHAFTSWNQYLSSLMILLLSGFVVAIPFTLGSSPTEASKHISIDWFAEGMFVDVSDIEPFNASVFNTWDNLGAHVGNIAIRRLSPSFLPIDIAQSRNTRWACWYMRERDVNLIYTATGQALALVESGCDQFGTYLENGRRIDKLLLLTRNMVVDKTVSTSSLTKGTRFLSTGFSEPEPWGTWADGFHSSIQMQSRVIADELNAKFSLRRVTSHQQPLRIETFINGTRVLIDSVPVNKDSALISIPGIKAGDFLSFQFVCGRTELEALTAANDPGGTGRCVGVQDFLITTSGNQPVGLESQ
jgi:hypothetical protein